MKHMVQLLKGLIALVIAAIAFAILAYVINQWPGVLLILVLIVSAYTIGEIFM